MGTFTHIADVLYQVGEMVTLDDINDYGKFDRPHHWMVGELIRAGALLGGLLALIGEEYAKG
jgi:hypothetical protein